jgi:glutamyl-tRNA reductase
MSVLFVGASHATAPLATIERLGFSGDDAAASLGCITPGDRAPTLPLRELVILSTCHRVELYAVPADDVRDSVALDAMSRLLSERAGPDDHVDGAIRRLAGTDATRHLFRVASGLESIVLGETDVLAQVQTALALSLRFGAAGMELAPLFESAARVGRRARAETSIATAPASVSSIAAELAEELADELRGRRALFVGTAKVGRLAAKALRSRGYWEMSLVAVTPDSADLSAELGATPVSIDAMPRAIAESDLVITCAASPAIDAATVRQAMRGRMARPIAFIDLGAGSGLDPAVADLAGVRVLGSVELRERIDLAIAGRRREAPLVETIVEEALRAHQARAEGSSLSGVVAALRARAEEIRQRELARAVAALPDADARTRAQLEWLSVSLVNKLLDEPTRRLRAEASNEHANPYADVTRELFGLTAERGDRPTA